MPTTTPSERLEARRMTAQCRICRWLGTLTESERKDWQKAIFNPRFSAGMVADEIRIDQQASDYDGDLIGESSVTTHRNGAHT